MKRQDLALTVGMTGAVLLLTPACLRGMDSDNLALLTLYICNRTHVSSGCCDQLDLFVRCWSANDPVISAMYTEPREMFGSERFMGTVLFCFVVVGRTIALWKAKIMICNLHYVPQYCALFHRVSFNSFLLLIYVFYFFCLVNKFNSLNTKRRLLYLKTQFVPRSKHFSSRL
jgi:hypothetical protein